MIAYLRNIVELYNYIFYELQDERTRKWFPQGIVLFTILISYYYFCKSLGPKLMKHRKPYELKNTILVFNVFQIIINFYLFIGGIYICIYTGINLLCQPIDYSENPLYILCHNLAWTYLVVKIIDLLDTVFFVFRKKERQISTLHLFHHLVMPICAFIGVKYYPNGHALLLGLINSFVHTIMYSYYLIAGLGPKYQKYLWWKRYVTVLQLVQFILIFIHNLIPLVFGCDYPKWINVATCIFSSIFIYMFGAFYYDNYVKKNSTKEKYN